VAPAAHGISETDYTTQQPAIQLAGGEEVGRFKLGSTVILLSGPGAVKWQQSLEENTALQMGEKIGDVVS